MDLAVVTQLGQDIEALALLGTQFDDVLITTRNEHALISERGGYASLQTTAMPFRVSSRRVSLRIDPIAPLTLSRSAINFDKKLPGSIVASSPSDSIHHRVQFVNDYDERVAKSLDQNPTCYAPLDTTDHPSENVVPLNAVRQARVNWECGDAGMHLNDLLRSNGELRRQCLPYLGENKAWQVLTPVLRSFLTYLKDRELPFARMVPSGGVLQAQSGAIKKLDQFGDVWIMGDGRSMFTLDLSGLHELWVIASKHHWQLELYSKVGKCFAVLSSDPWSASASWREVLASLPRLRCD
ncbi:hypothetical protein J7399_19335 [Shimia sp. R9_1]|uniref:hypothetical protein n=1 Tax=Shimia sp. R9_1 TaxID=2821111 RepID=UPI001ADB1E4A|nr:hypothetical protein [Shimia sp. R9_1]MBO9409599.1 hypothetical protein [Shimia sp. R9_1]